MPEKLSRAVIELSIEPVGVRAELVAWLHEQGIEDFVEASCDVLDGDADAARAELDAYERGQVELPLLLYSYDTAWIAAMKAALLVRFADRLHIRERTLSDELWQEAWQSDWVRLETTRFVVQPEGLRDPEERRTTLYLRSDGVFGSGQHATTQALLLLLEKQTAFGRLLDVGTGTGILALAAHHLGYTEVWATDIEDQAIAVARYNQMLNGITFTLLPVSLPEPIQTFETIVCNILPPTLTHLLPALVERLEPHGRLLLAGYHGAHREEIDRILGSLGLNLAEQLEQRGWLASLYFKRR